MKYRAVALLVPLAGCAHALRTPPPLEKIAPAPDAGAEQLLARADEAWSRRADLARAEAAEQVYLQAARADPRSAAAYAGAIRAKAFRIGREKDGGKRGQLAADAVAVGQLCEENAAPSPLCDYWLAAAPRPPAPGRPSPRHHAPPPMGELLPKTAPAHPPLHPGGPHPPAPLPPLP